APAVGASGGAGPARARMAAARLRGAVRGAGDLLLGSRQGGREPGVLLRAVRAAVRAAARRALDARAAVAVPRSSRRAGGRFRRRGLRRVRPQDALSEPQGGGGERVRQLLPRQLAVL